VESQEAVREDAAAQEGAKLLLDEAGRGLASALRTRKEGLQLVADDLVKEGLLRLVALVLGHEIPGRDRIMERTLRSVGAFRVAGSRRMQQELGPSLP
jgi:hypothetical protein